MAPLEFEWLDIHTCFTMFTEGGNCAVARRMLSSFCTACFHPDSSADRSHIGGLTCRPASSGSGTRSPQLVPLGSPRFKGRGLASPFVTGMMDELRICEQRMILGVPGITTRNKNATRGSWPYY